MHVQECGSRCVCIRERLGEVGWPRQQHQKHLKVASQIWTTQNKHHINKQAGYKFKTHLEQQHPQEDS